MPVFNGAAYLHEAVESILAQTLANFEFLIVDDASTDATPEILRRYASRDERIRILTNRHNMERSVSRNKAIDLARSELIAVMDADDVSLPDRFEKQVAFMRANPDVVVVGGHRLLYESGVVLKAPLTDGAIRVVLFWMSPFCHSSAMLRRSPCLRTGGYRQEYVPSEDYDLWCRLAAMTGWRFANLDEVLLRYREHPGVDRNEYRARQNAVSLSISRAYLLDLGMSEDELDMEAHAVLGGRADPGSAPLSRVCNWAERLIRFNAEKGICAPEAFSALCRERLRDNSIRAPWLPPGVKKYIPATVKAAVKKACLFCRKKMSGNHDVKPNL
jgi:hypothetical protein